LTKSKLNTLEEGGIKFHNLKDPQRRMPNEDWTAFGKRITEWQANRGYLRFPNEPQQRAYRTSPRKLTRRPKAGTLRARWLEELEREEDLTGGIRNTGHQNDSESSTPLIAELRVDWTFEDEAEEEGASVTDLVLSALRLLREDIREVVDSMEPVEPWDEG
jgi:hypothetical protein